SVGRPTNRQPRPRHPLAPSDGQRARPHSHGDTSRLTSAHQATGHEAGMSRCLVRQASCQGDTSTNSSTTSTISTSNSNSSNSSSLQETFVVVRRIDRPPQSRASLLCSPIG
ncbi:unnamed protein product, partial [Protopolystoma xenopodis]